MRRPSPIVLVALLGCGPARIASSGAETQADAGTSTGSATSDANDESDDPTGDDPTGPTGDGDGDGQGFVPDGPDLPFQCDMFAQDCPAGEKCVPDLVAWSDYRCVPVLGDKGVGESCSHAGQRLGSDDCDADSHCWQVDEDGFGRCVPFCGGTPDNPGDCGSAPGCEGYDCWVYGQVGIPICEPRCDPLAQDCPDGLSCSLDSGYGWFKCWVVDQSVAVGEVCEYLNACPPGSLCVDGSLLPDCAGAACCAPVCDLADPDAAAADCAALPGSACVDVLPVVDVGCGDIGLCGVQG